MAKRRRWWRGQGPLRPAELAEAAVLADVSVALIAIGWLLPITTVFIALAMAPMAAVAARNRPRAVVAAAISGATVATLLGGTALASNVVACALLGSLVGVAWRRRWGMLRMVLVADCLFWPPAALLADGVLTVVHQLRVLVLDQITNTWAGAKANLRFLGLVRLTHLLDPVVRGLVRHWAVGVPAALLVAISAGTVAGRVLAWPPLARLERTRLPAPDGEGLGKGAVPDDAPPAPVPVRLLDVEHRYPGTSEPALTGVSLSVEAGQFVAVVGPNGSGKSTLAALLGGRNPTRGQVTRPGPVGRGRAGGTAMIFQRPESQVLGVRVRDDLVWGLPRELAAACDLEALLGRVGLSGFAERETSTLSGGELQRLAVASALARRPRLLISDESTAMVDAEGRALLTDLLAGLAADEGLAVVHVTHRVEEAQRADRVLFLDRGRVVAAPPATSTSTSAPAPAAAAAAAAAAGVLSALPGSGGSLELAGVGHVYTAGSPWAHRSLSGIDLSVPAGQAVLVVGHNGSGKSTLAWILAGLLSPTEGRAFLDGHPVDERVGQVALSFQHARLQLLRSTVRRDVSAASGVDGAGADAALELVGLDPAALGGRAIDQLSGGQQRRVALAGMLARRPRVLILDEPFAGLDDAARRSLIAVLGRLRAETGVTLVLVSHDLEGAADLVDRVVTLQQGRIVADHPAPLPAGRTT